MTNIPKIIHFFHDEDVQIWKKDKKPQFRMCYMSWKQFCPDYKIMHWHDGMSEFQEMLKRSKFLRTCYELKMWAFVSDYVRAYALYKYGGVYLDTDVQLIKPLDEFLNDECFVSIEGSIYHGYNLPEPAVIGGVKGHKLFSKMMEFYESDEVFALSDFMAPVALLTILKKNSDFTRIKYKTNELEVWANSFYDRNEFNQLLETIEQYNNQEIYVDEDLGLKIYPSEYLCPSWHQFGEKALTDKTVAIHWNQSSWWGNATSEKKLAIINSMKYTGIRRFFVKNRKIIFKLINLFVWDKKKRNELRRLFV